MKFKLILNRCMDFFASPLSQFADKCIAIPCLPILSLIDKKKLIGFTWIFISNSSKFMIFVPPSFSTNFFFFFFFLLLRITQRNFHVCLGPHHKSDVAYEIHSKSITISVEKSRLPQPYKICRTHRPSFTLCDLFRVWSGKCIDDCKQREQQQQKKNGQLMKYTHD